MDHYWAHWNPILGQSGILYRTSWIPVCTAKWAQYKLPSLDHSNCRDRASTGPKVKCLLGCVRVPWKYIKVCGYSDFFAKKKTWTKGHWPLDDLWPHICWGHMCDSTQGSLCPSPMKIHQSMWIQWTFLLKLEPKVIDP